MKKKKIMRGIGQDERKQRGRINRMKRWVRSGDANIASIVTRVRKQIDTQNRWIGIDIKRLIQKYIEYLSIGISTPNRNNMDVLVCIVWASRTSKVLKVVILMLMLILILIYILPVKVV